MKVYALIFITMITFTLSAQNKDIVLQSSFRTNLRVSDLLGTEYFSRFTRFSPVYYSGKTDHYSSPAVRYYINGLSYDVFPFNHRSIDLLPSDQILLGSYCAGYDETATGFSVNLEENNIIAGKEFTGRIFTGSETGDPIIFSFTRDNLKTSNKNKIVPSGSLSFSTGSERNRLRIATGYYGYFATGSYNDPLLFSLNTYFTGRQNKQFFGSVTSQNQLSSGADLNFFGSAMTFYGWELTPFINSIQHFESYLYTAGVQYNSPDNKFKLSLKKDGLITETHSIKGWQPLKYAVDDYKIIGRFNFDVSENLQSDFYVETSFLSARNLKPRSSEYYQNYLSDNIQQLRFNPVLSARYNFNKRFSASLSGAYEYGLGRKSAVSGKLNLNYYPVNEGHSVFVSFSSVARFPGTDELYGNIIATDNQNKNNQSLVYTVSGNRNLKPERINDITTGYSASLRDLKINVSLFYSVIIDPIMQIPTLIVRTEQGNVLRNAKYLNHTSEFFFGTQISFSYKLFSFLLLKGSYFRNSSGDSRHIPENRLLLTSEAEFPFSAKLIFQFASRGRVRWQDFMVTPGNDYLSGRGLDGIIDKFSIFSLSYIQKLELQGLLEELLIKLSIENIFDRDALYHPLGNRPDRLITASAFIKIF